MLFYRLSQINSSSRTGRVCLSSNTLALLRNRRVYLWKARNQTSERISKHNNPSQNHHRPHHASYVSQTFKCRRSLLLWSLMLTCHLCHPQYQRPHPRYVILNRAILFFCKCFFLFFPLTLKVWLCYHSVSVLL